MQDYRHKFVHRVVISFLGDTNNDNFQLCSRTLLHIVHFLFHIHSHLQEKSNSSFKDLKRGRKKPNGNVPIQLFISSLETNPGKHAH